MGVIVDMGKGEKLIKNIIIYTIGTFGSKLLTFLLLPLYSSELTKAEYGIYDFIVTVTTLFLPVLTMHLESGLYRFLFDVEQDDYEEICSYCFGSIVRNVLAVNIIFLLINIFVTLKYAGLILIYLDISAIYPIWQQWCRGTQRVAVYSISGILNTLIVLCVNIVGLLIFHLDYSCLIIGQIAGQIVGLLYIEAKTGLRKVLSFNTYLHNRKSVRRKEILMYSLPLIPTTIVWWVLNASDRMMITFIHGSEMNGVYAMACKIPSIITVINSFFFFAWGDSVLETGKDDEALQYYNKTYEYYIKFISGITLLMLAYNRIFFGILVQGEFSRAYMYAPMLYLGCMFNAFGSYFTSFFNLYKKNGPAAVTVIIGALINFIGNLLLIPHYGINGAAVTTMIGTFLIWFSKAYLIRKYISIRVNKRSWGIIWFVFLVGLLLYFNLNVLNLVFMLVAPVLFLIWNKSIVQELWNRILVRMKKPL